MLHSTIYGGVEALQGASQHQLLELLCLARRCQVAAAAEAAEQLLAAIPAEQLEWEVVEEVFAFVTGAQQSRPAPEALLESAGARLQHELGDLDAAMQDEQARRRLMALPLPMLCVLLCDPRTRASCEATALAVASAWFADPAAAQQRERPGVREQQVAALAECVRFGRLQPAVLAAVAPRTEWVAAVISQQQLLDLTAFATGGSRQQGQQLRAGGGLVAAHPQWFLPPRPSSAVEWAALSLEVPGAEARAAVARARATGQAESLEGRGLAFFRGFWWHPELEVTPTRTGVRYDLRLGITSGGLFEPHASQRVACRVMVVEGSGEAGLSTRSRGALVAVDGGWGWRDCWGLGSAQKEWDADAFRAKGLMKGRSMCVKVVIKAA